MSDDIDMRVNLTRHGNIAMEAASAAGGAFATAHGTDLMQWTTETWRQFIWTVLATGVQRANTENVAEYQQALREIDAIPY